MAPASRSPKVALITGAARGNGLAIAQALGEAGCSLYLLDLPRPVPGVPYALSTPAELEAAVADLRRRFPRVQGLLGDVRVAGEVHAAVRQVEQAEGGVDILVNNAGLLVLHPIAQVSEAEWRLHLDVMATGAFLCCQRVLPQMNARGWGRIVNVASVAGQVGLGTGVAYTAAKHALVGLTRALAMEVARQHVTVNAVCPGSTATPLLAGTARALGLSEQQAAAQLLGRHLTGQPIQPQDVAAAVAWLASDAAARVNGTCLFVDDGWTAH
ncbi:MAG TPA: SDR family oxidoreductase [bacterium]|nr:SDR family oxidoreductase [bacterium]